MSTLWFFLHQNNGIMAILLYATLLSSVWAKPPEEKLIINKLWSDRERFHCMSNDGLRPVWIITTRTFGYLILQIQDKLSIVQSSHGELLETYKRRLEEFEHNLDAQTFHRDAEQAEAWIAFRESFLGNEDDDLGVRLQWTPSNLDPWNEATSVFRALQNVPKYAS